MTSGAYSYLISAICQSAYLFNESDNSSSILGKKGLSRDRGSLSSPTAIAIDSNNYVYISKSNVGVSIFDREGCFVKALNVCLLWERKCTYNIELIYDLQMQLLSSQS